MEQWYMHLHISNNTLNITGVENLCNLIMINQSTFAKKGIECLIGDFIPNKPGLYK